MRTILNFKIETDYTKKRQWNINAVASQSKCSVLLTEVIDEVDNGQRNPSQFDWTKEAPHSSGTLAPRRS
jgi:hypothetical protein